MAKARYKALSLPAPPTPTVPTGIQGRAPTHGHTYGPLFNDPAGHSDPSATPAALSRTYEQHSTLLVKEGFPSKGIFLNLDGDRNTNLALISQSGIAPSAITAQSKKKRFSEHFGAGQFFSNLTIEQLSVFVLLHHILSDKDNRIHNIPWRNMRHFYDTCMTVDGELCVSHESKAFSFTLLPRFEATFPQAVIKANWLDKDYVFPPMSFKNNSSTEIARFVLACAGAEEAYGADEAFATKLHDQILLARATTAAKRNEQAVPAHPNLTWS